MFEGVKRNTPATSFMLLKIVDRNSKKLCKDTDVLMLLLHFQIKLTPDRCRWRSKMSQANLGVGY